MAGRQGRVARGDTARSAEGDDRGEAKAATARRSSSPADPQRPALRPSVCSSRGEILAAAAQRSVDNGIGALLAAVVLAGLGVLLAASPSPDLAFLLQVAATGAFVGTIVVY